MAAKKKTSRSAKPLDKKSMKSVKGGALNAVKAPSISDGTSNTVSGRIGGIAVDPSDPS